MLAKEKYGLRGRELQPHEARFIPVHRATRMSGVNYDGREIRKGAVDAIENTSTETAPARRKRSRDRRRIFRRTPRWSA